jgi:hypothetical protein
MPCRAHTTTTTTTITEVCFCVQHAHYDLVVQQLRRGQVVDDKKNTPLSAGTDVLMVLHWSWRAAVARSADVPRTTARAAMVVMIP